jgi:hypothetical protein
MNADGTANPTFGGALGSGFNAEVEWIIGQPDGQLLVGGSFTSLNGVTTNRIVRLSAGGVVDPSFAGVSGAFNNVVQYLMPQSDGSIIAAGFFTTFGGVASSSVARLILPVPTATSLALSSPTVSGTDITATAIVTYSTGSAVGSGSVSFYVDPANPVAPSGPPASTVTLTSGGAQSTIHTAALVGSPAGTTHTVVAVFTDGPASATSTSGVASFAVLTYAPDPQFIQTSIPPGTLVISTPYTAASPLVLPAMTLNAGATLYSTTAAFSTIQVTDTRPGNLPYSLSALSSALTKAGVASPNANEIISAQNVGLTGLTLGSTNVTPGTFLGAVVSGGPTSGQNLTGFDDPAAAGLGALAPGTAGLGGAAPHVVLHANAGLGTTTVNGLLTINAPTNTLDGTYNGLVTFTILGS